jgi:hypothetical protein
MPDSAALAELNQMIDSLDRADRANPRPRMIAHFDENGDEQRRVHVLPQWMKDAK